MVLTGTSKARSHVTDLNDEAQAIIFETRQCLKLRAQGGPIKSFKGENMDTQEIKDSTKEPEKKKRRKPVDVSIEALRFLYAYGPLYKSDFLKFLNQEDKGSDPYDRLRNAMKKELGTDGILERQIKPQGIRAQARQSATIVALSQAGKECFLAHDVDGPSKNKLTASKDSLFTTIRLDRILYPHLAEQKAHLMYRLAGVYTYPYEKPSLGYLLYHLTEDQSIFNIKETDENGKEINRHVRPYNRKYLDRSLEGVGIEQKRKSLSSFLELGAYYSKNEVREFLKLFGKNNTDNIEGITWHGIFLNRTSFYINFVLSDGENKRMYVMSETLSNLIEKLKATIISITGCGDTVSAVTIGIGSSHTYSEAMGNKYGLIKTKDMTVLESEKRRYDVVDCTSKHFTFIFSIDDRQLGIDMLHYVTNTSLNNYRENETALFASDGRFKILEKSYENLFPATYESNGAPAIYMPVYEIKTLKRIADLAKTKDRGFVIVTRKAMMETISHCLHIESIEDPETRDPSPGLWFVELICKNPPEIKDEETFKKRQEDKYIKLQIEKQGKPADQLELNKEEKEKFINDQVAKKNRELLEDISGLDDDKLAMGDLIDEKSGIFNIYNQNGFISGRAAVDEYFLKGGKKLASEGEYLKLARLFNFEEEGRSNFETRCRFYNAIARMKDKDKEQYLDKVKKVLVSEDAEDIPEDGIRYKLFEPEEKQNIQHNINQINIVMTADLKKRVKKAASSRSVSVSYFIRDLLQTVLDRADTVAEEKGISRSKALNAVMNEIMTPKTK